MKENKLFVKLVQMKKYWIFFLLFLVIFISIIVTYDTYFIKILNTIWVNPIASYFSNGLGLFGNIAVILIILIYYIFVYINEKYRDLKRFFIVLPFASFTLLCQISGNWIFYSYKDINILTYANIIYFIFLLDSFIIIKYYLKKKDNNQTSILKYDTDSAADKDDKYGRKEYANTIAKILKSNFSDQGSFCFGVIGKWGSGKSTFMNLIKKRIDGDKTIVTIDFNVWKAKSPTEIIDEFFGQYNKIIEKHCPSLSNTINNYARILIQAIYPEGEKWYHRIALLREKTNNKAMYDEICEVLKNSQINVLIFIDDLDRLNNSEILEVLRLIRNTVNFPYTQFVVAYDKDYVVKSLENNGIVNAAEYLEKIYNAEIYLPTFRKMIIIENIETNLNSFFEDKKITKDSLSSQLRLLVDEKIGSEDDNYLIPKLFTTQRDVIRFTNSFKINLVHFIDNGIYGSINIEDFFYLELVRYAFPDIYEIIRINPCDVLDLNFKEKRYVFSDYADGRNDIFKGRCDEKIIKIILKTLFPETGGNLDSVCSYRKFPICFSFNLDPKCLQFSEVIDAISSENPSAIVENWVTNKHDREIYDRMAQCFRIIESVVPIRSDRETKLSYRELYQFVNKLLKTEDSNYSQIYSATYEHIKHLSSKTDEQFFELIKLWFVILEEKISNPLDDIDILSNILYKRNLKNYQHRPMEEKDEETIFELLRNSEASLQLSPCIREFIDIFNSSKTKETLLLPIDRLGEILISYLRNYTSAPTNVVDDNFFTLFRCCMDIIKPLKTGEFLNIDALEIACTFITEKPEGYFAKFIEKESILFNKFNLISPEPFYKRIFENNETFESFITDEKLSSLNGIAKVRNYWILYKNNNYNPIEFSQQKSIKDIIDSDFVEFKTKVEELIEIQSEVERLKSDPNLNEVERLRRLAEKKEDVRAVNFDIKLTRDIIEKIDEAFPSLFKK